MSASSGDRIPAHEIDPDPPPCPSGFTALGLVREQLVPDKSVVLVPTQSGLKGRIYIAPVAGSDGRALVARTSQHTTSGAAGAFANPNLCDLLGAKKETHNFVCVRKAKWWEPFKYESGLKPALVPALANIAGAIAVGVWASMKDLGSGYSFWPVAIVLALTLGQASSGLYTTLADLDARTGLGSAIAGFTVILLLFSLFAVHGFSIH